MVECNECGTDGAGIARVSYTTGETEELELCTQCKQEYMEGGFVASVSEGALAHE